MVCNSCTNVHQLWGFTQATPSFSGMVGHHMRVFQSKFMSMSRDSSHSDGLKVKDTEVEKAGLYSLRCILMFPSVHSLHDVSVAS